MLQEIVFVVDEAPEGGYAAHALGASIFTEAVDLKDLHTQIQDAVACHFEADTRPQVIYTAMVAVR